MNKISIVTLVGLIAISMLLGMAGCSSSETDLALELVYGADLSQWSSIQDKETAMSSVMDTLERRFDAYEVDGWEMEQVRTNRILVRLPVTENIESIKQLIPASVLVCFMEFHPFVPENNNINYGHFVQRLDDDDKVVLTEIDRADVQEGESAWVAVPAVGTVDGNEIELTSQYFKGSVEFGIFQNDHPTIHFEWDDTGSDLFWQITSRLSSEIDGSVERKLGIFLGDEYVSSPNVNEPIRDNGIITGMAKDEAKWLTSLLNAGRMDVPLYIVEEHDIRQ